MTKAIMETSIINSFRKIIEGHGFKDSGDSVKFEKKNSDKSVSVKAQEIGKGDMAIRVRTTNRLTNKKSETIFHNVTSASAITGIIESLAF